jgi:hypothetical protein
MPTLAPGATLGEVAEIIHAAVVLGPAAWGREPMPEAHLGADIEAKLKFQLIDLFRILHERKIPYVLVGGIAMLTYIEGRNTKDIDLILPAESLKSLPEVILLNRRREFVHGTFGDLKVDLLLTSNPLFDLVANKHRTRHRFLETDFDCATIEGLILMKLFALTSLYERGDWAKIALFETDIYMLYAIERPEIEPILQTLHPFVRTGQFYELRMFIDEMKQRIIRLDRAKKSDPLPQ